MRLIIKSFFILLRGFGEWLATYLRQIFWPMTPLLEMSGKGQFFYRRGGCQFMCLVKFLYPGNLSLVQTQCSRLAWELQAVDDQ